MGLGLGLGLANPNPYPNPNLRAEADLATHARPVRAHRDAARALARVPGRVGGGVVRVSALDERRRVDAGEGAVLVLRARLGEELVGIGGDDREVDEEAAGPRGLG